MVLIVGLGNPGKKFKNTRHNVGFRVVDRLRKKNDFPTFRSSKKFNSLISESTLKRKKVVLAKPQTFMNDSGKAIKKLISGFRLQASGLWVIHDDIDLPLGKIRISKTRGAAGHKGVQSIIDELNTKDFTRFRIGIKPKNYNLQFETLKSFVLKNFTKEEKKVVKESIKKTVSAIEMAITEGLKKAMQEHNK